MATTRRTVALVGVGAVLVATALALWGLAGRDLAGDELDMLHGSPGQILAWSLDPRGGFVGHLPLSFWARWLSLSLFSETPAWAWRLHAVLATGLAAGLTATTAARHLGRAAAGVAGALVAVDPIVAFHAQEASNYAGSVLVGALVVRGLLDLSAHDRRGGAWLAAGLLAGATNDFYSVLLAAPAAAVCLWLARRPSLRRSIAAAWLVPALVVAPFALLFLARLLESTGSAVVEVHADPLPPRPLPAALDAPWRVARRHFGAHLHGYAGGRNDTPWLGLPPVAFAVVTTLAALRGRTWPAAVLVAGALLVHGLCGVGLQLGAARILPYEPRVLIGVVPAMALVFASFVPHRLGRWAAVVWLVGSGLSTFEARSSAADLRAQALAHALTLDLGPPIVDDARTRTRAPRSRPCAEALPAVWVVNHTAQAADLPRCGAPAPEALTHRTFFDAPVHEGSAASFLPRRVVAVAGAEVDPAPLRVDRAFLDGLDGATWELTDASGAVRARGTDPTTFPRPSTDGLRIAALPTAPPWLPDHLLLRAFRNQVQGWELDPLDRRPVLRAAPLQAPAIVSLRHLLPVLGSLLAGLLLLLRRRP